MFRISRDSVIFVKDDTKGGIFYFSISPPFFFTVRDVSVGMSTT